MRVFPSLTRRVSKKVQLLNAAAWFFEVFGLSGFESRRASCIRGGSDYFVDVFCFCSLTASKTW